MLLRLLMNILNRKIGLGTVQFGVDYGISNETGRTSCDEVSKILNFARCSGVRYLDTAYAYGLSEEVLGKFNLNSFKIVSKYIPSEVSIDNQFSLSMKRLNIESIYGYLAHRPIDLIKDNKKNWNILKRLKSEGKVRKIGASFNFISELEEVDNIGLDLDIIQVPYNYFDRRFEGKMSELKRRGVEIHTRSAFLQGLFFCEPSKLSVHFDEVKVLLARLQKIEKLPQVLLDFVISNKDVDIVNIGVNNLKQLEENINYLGKMNIAVLPNIRESISDEILIPSFWKK
jgi:aryl-alcohol dehydrogenase-like predicted oxidoreductase